METEAPEFEHLGFFEELSEAGTHRFLGTRIVATQDRPLGYAGRKAFTVTEPLTLTRGNKTKTFRASAKKPLHVVAMLQTLCGKRL